MTIQFPSFIPSERSLKLGDYPVRRYSTYSGAVVRRLYGLLPSGYELRLVFGGQGGLLDSDAALIYQAWLDAEGDLSALFLPGSIWGGMGDGIPQRVENEISWHFSVEPPQIETTVPGRSRVSLTLDGRLQA